MVGTQPHFPRHLAPRTRFLLLDLHIANPLKAPSHSSSLQHFFHSAFSPLSQTTSNCRSILRYHHCHQSCSIPAALLSHTRSKARTASQITCSPPWLPLASTTTNTSRSNRSQVASLSSLAALSVCCRMSTAAIPFPQRESPP